MMQVREHISNPDTKHIKLKCNPRNGCCWDYDFLQPFIAAWQFFKWIIRNMNSKCALLC